jgi:hypothetical protein
MAHTPEFDVAAREENIKSRLRPTYTERIPTPKITVDWLDALGDQTRRARLPVSSVRRIIGDLAWEDRARGVTVWSWDEYLATAAGRPEIEPDAIRENLAWYISQRRRFDFQFYSVLNECQKWTNTNHDAQLQAVITLSEFGLRLPSAMQRLEATKQLPDCDFVAIDILLQGLCFSAYTVEHAERILKLSDELGEMQMTVSTTHFRRSVAFRILRDFAQARVEILMAMETLQAGRNDVHQEYVREHQLILALEER